MSFTRLKDRPVLLADHQFVCRCGSEIASIDFEHMPIVAPLARPMMVCPIWVAIALVAGVMIGLFA